MTASINPVGKVVHRTVYNLVEKLDAQEIARLALLNEPEGFRLESWTIMAEYRELCLKYRRLYKEPSVPA